MYLRYLRKDKGITLEKLLAAFVQSGLPGGMSWLSDAERGKADMGPVAEGWLEILDANDKQKREFRRRAHLTSPVRDVVKVDETLGISHRAHIQGALEKQLLPPSFVSDLVYRTHLVESLTSDARINVHMVLGLPGSGKTTLVAGLLDDRYVAPVMRVGGVERPVIWLDLRVCGHADAAYIIGAAAAQVVRARQEAPPPDVEALGMVSLLDRVGAILVIDHIEHVIDADGAIPRSIADVCASVRVCAVAQTILISSRWPTAKWPTASALTSPSTIRVDGLSPDAARELARGLMPQCPAETIEYLATVVGGHAGAVKRVHDAVLAGHDLGSRHIGDDEQAIWGLIDPMLDDIVPLDRLTSLPPMEQFALRLVATARGAMSSSIATHINAKPPFAAVVANLAMEGWVELAPTDRIMKLHPIVRHRVNDAFVAANDIHRALGAAYNTSIEHALFGQYAAATKLPDHERLTRWITEDTRIPRDAPSEEQVQWAMEEGQVESGEVDPRDVPRVARRRAYRLAESTGSVDGIYEWAIESIYHLLMCGEVDGAARVQREHRPGAFFLGRGNIERVYSLASAASHLVFYHVARVQASTGNSDTMPYAALVCDMVVALFALGKANEARPLVRVLGTGDALLILARVAIDTTEALYKAGRFDEAAALIREVDPLIRGANKAATSRLFAIFRLFVAKVEFRSDRDAALRAVFLCEDAAQHIVRTSTRAGHRRWMDIVRRGWPGGAEASSGDVTHPSDTIDATELLCHAAHMKAIYQFACDDTAGAHASFAHALETARQSDRPRLVAFVMGQRARHLLYQDLLRDALAVLQERLIVLDTCTLDADLLTGEYLQVMDLLIKIGDYEEARQVGENYIATMPLPVPMSEPKADLRRECRVRTLIAMARACLHGQRDQEARNLYENAVQAARVGYDEGAVGAVALGAEIERQWEQAQREREGAADGDATLQPIIRFRQLTLAASYFVV